MAYKASEGKRVWGYRAYPKGPCAHIVYTLAIGTTLRPKYVLFGHLDP